MSNDKSSGNPFMDMWLDNQEQFFKPRHDWLDPAAHAKPDTDFFSETTRKGWEQCEQQFNSWLRTADNWFASQPQTRQQPGASGGSYDHGEAATDALRLMLNPKTFLKSGFEQLNQTFLKLVDGPEFADIGKLEKKILKTSSDWLALRKAGDEYQAIVAQAWMRAFTKYSGEFSNLKAGSKTSAKSLLDRWLQIADEEMVATLRSKEYLQAQKNLFSAGISYKQKHREFAELWCENNSIPTRTEVDDLHKVMYELRREVRELKKQVQLLQTGKVPATAPAKKVTKKPLKKSRPASTKSVPPGKKKAAKPTTEDKPKAKNAIAAGSKKSTKAAKKGKKKATKSAGSKK